MAQQCQDEITMAIESCCLSHQRQDAIGRCQREQRIDIRVAHPLGDEAQRELRRKLGLKAAAPALLVFA